MSNSSPDRSCTLRSCRCGIGLSAAAVQKWGSGDFARDTFYVWLIPPQVARADVARSAFRRQLSRRAQKFSRLSTSSS